jgi:hypothetical protein
MMRTVNREQERRDGIREGMKSRGFDVGLGG